MTSSITSSFPLNQTWSPVNRDSQQAIDNSNQNNHFRHDRVHENGTTQGVSDHAYHRAVAQVDNSNTQVTDATTQAAGAAMALQGISTSLNSDFQMQVTTKEGDVVNIGFNASTTHTQSAMQVQGADGQAFGVDEESAQSSAFNISVQGNISEAEKKSLSDLMQQIQQVGSSFFQGQTQNAFQQAQNVGFDAGQIAGFSMSMNLELSVQAVSAYQQNNQQSSIDAGPLKQMAGFFNQSMNNLSNAPQVLLPFTNSLDIFNSLSSGITEAVASQAPNNSNQQQPLDMLQQLMKLAGDLLFGTTNNPQQQSITTTDTTVVPTETPRP